MRLDEVTEQFEQTLKDFEDSRDAESFVYALNNNSYDFELATNMFIDLGSELHAGLEIIDPVLANCCHSLCVSKFDFLTMLSNFVHWDREGDKARLVIGKPQGIMETVDLNNLYKKARQGMEGDDHFYWPSSALDDFLADFKEVSITFEGDETAAEIRNMIREQNILLIIAKERLRVLIKDSFSIEEVLFQSDSQPYR